MKAQTIQLQLQLFNAYEQEILFLLDELERIENRLYKIHSQPFIKAGREQRQSGNDDRLLKLISEKDNIKSRLKFYSYYCNNIAKALCAADLTEEELQLLYMRYEKNMSYRDMEKNSFYSKDVWNGKMNDLIEKLTRRNE